MLKILLAWFLTAQGAKVGATTLGATSLLSLVLMLNNGMASRIDAQQDKIHSVELQIAPMVVKMNNTNSKVDNNHLMMRDIYLHLLSREPPKPKTD